MTTGAPMRSILLAIFGHYDSRGGTAAIPLPAEVCGRPKKTRRVSKAAIAEVRRAMKRYEKLMFGIDEPGDPIDTTAYGMPARKADQAVHDLLYGDESVGSADFMYVAELHYPEELAEFVEQEGRDLDEGETRVLLEWKANQRVDGAVESLTVKWPKLKVEVRTSTVGDQEFRSEIEDQASLIACSLIDPVQLELVKVPEGNEEARREAHDKIHAEAKEKGVFIGFSSTWTEEQHAEAKAHQDRYAATDREFDARIAAQSKLGGMIVTRWDDDAYGFVIARD